MRSRTELQRPGDNCITGELSMGDRLILYLKSEKENSF